MEEMRCERCGRLIDWKDFLFGMRVQLHDFNTCVDCIAKMNREAENKANYKQDIPKYTKT